MLVRALDGEVPCRLALRIELRPDSRVIRLQRAVRSIGRTNALFGKSNEYPQVIKLPSTRASTRCRPESGLPSRQNSRSSARFSECFERRHDSHPAAPRGVAGNVRFQLRERCFCALREWLVWVASRRWTATDGLHRLNGGNRPSPVIQHTRKLKFECPLPDQIQPFGRQTTAGNRPLPPRVYQQVSP